jgi:hypothetical protein
MRVARLKEAYPTAKVELWCEDEHRLGLKPIIRKVWSPVGERPVGKVHQRYQWTYLYAFARPKKTGEVCWLVLPTVSAEVFFSLALENFAKEIGAGKEETHPARSRSSRVAHGQEEAQSARKGIHLEFLPSHSPELQPSERLWPLSDEAVANRYFEEIEDLEEALVRRCVALGDQPERSSACILATTGGRRRRKE